MPKQRSWTDDQLIAAVKTARSYRAVLQALSLIPAGGNYAQIQKRVAELDIDTRHFLGKGWSKDQNTEPVYEKSLAELLTKGSNYQSHKLKKRLFLSGLKQAACELCGWCTMSVDGRVPVELDHINGIHNDNRIENLRILCPNCHSLQVTHRGRNKKVALTKYARVS